jgi:hypothetical protein
MGCRVEQTDFFDDGRVMGPGTCICLDTHSRRMEWREDTGVEGDGGKEKKHRMTRVAWQTEQVGATKTVTAAETDTTMYQTLVL